jgi:RNA polymerase sigma-70 factor (ECF subfamily)
LPAELRPESANERVRALYEEHASTLLKYARRRHAGLAEDVVSETFAVAVRRAHDIPDGRELAWLYVVADYTLRNMLRGQGRADRLTTALRPLTPLAAEPAATPVIGEALGELPERQRLLLTKTAFEGYSAEEAAEQLGIPYGSARNALVTGRRKLALSLAALGAAMMLAFVLRPMLLGGTAADRAPATIRSSISAAGAIHDVALVHRAGRASATGTRYERWSDPSGARQRVVLPTGQEITTRAGETLRQAAQRMSDAAGGTSNRSVLLSKSVRADLTALDAAAPPAIADVLADRRASRSSRPGPRIRGRETTIVSGRITTPGGIEQTVSTTIANDAKTVLRVRAQRFANGRATGTPSIVEFEQWTPLPKGAASEAVLPEIADAGTGTDSRARASAPPPTREPWVDTATVAAASRAAATVAGTGDRSPTVRDSATAERPKADRLATNPIVHLKQSVEFCVTATSCAPRGVFDIWLEQGGRSRARMTQRKVDGGPIRSERWVDGDRAFYYLHSNTGRTHGALLDNPQPAKLGALFQFFGAWQQELLPELQRLRRDAAAVAALPAGPDVDGHPTVVATASVLDIDRRTRLDAQLQLDPATRLPRQIVVVMGSAPVPDELRQQRYTLRFSAFDELPAGRNAALVRSHFPAEARISDYR